MSFQLGLPDYRDPDFYPSLATQARALLAGETDAVANAANLAALLFNALPRINWAGFYFLREGELVLGPFQGLPACVRIPLGRGVCGTAAQSGETLRVEDVHAFPGHIACDAASRSEIVIPLFSAGTVMGVLDIDSPEPGRFDARDQEGIEALARAFEASLQV
jgi:L-methionine (R)-S-oxide reductase